jgi:hypothetical protein
MESHKIHVPNHQPVYIYILMYIMGSIDGIPSRLGQGQEKLEGTFLNTSPKKGFIGYMYILQHKLDIYWDL